MAIVEGERMTDVLAPSELELQVLSLLWERGPLTVRQVQELLPDGKKRAYTTVLTVLQVMERKRLVRHTREGLTHVFAVAVTRRRIVGPLMRKLLQNVFGGRASAAVQCLVRDGDVSEEELRAMRQVIEQATKDKR
jgi:BlaI family transcriptional regulator, penicillinase repressor